MHAKRKSESPNILFLFALFLRAIPPQSWTWPGSRLPRRGWRSLPPSGRRWRSASRRRGFLRKRQSRTEVPRCTRRSWTSCSWSQSLESLGSGWHWCRWRLRLLGKGGKGIAWYFNVSASISSASKYSEIMELKAQRKFALYIGHRSSCKESVSEGQTNWSFQPAILIIIPSEQFVKEAGRGSHDPGPPAPDRSRSFLRFAWWILADMLGSVECPPPGLRSFFIFSLKKKTKNTFDILSQSKIYNPTRWRARHSPEFFWSCELAKINLCLVARSSGGTWF